MRDVNVYGVIPARLESTRLPRKLLLAGTGKPLIQHTWESARRARSLSELIIATDSHELAESVTGFGARCQLTGPQPSGTDRLAEVAKRLGRDHDIFVNIQGDEPMINPDQLVTLKECFSDEVTELATLVIPVTDPIDPFGISGRRLCRYQNSAGSRKSPVF